MDDVSVQQRADARVLNALSVDVEDYFQVEAFADIVKREEWPTYPSRVVANTEMLLRTFGDVGVSGTFFVLGWIAERFPALVRAIAAAGHEIACHGYTHQRVSRQTASIFRDETYRAKSLLEDITGRRVNGYRAATFSIVDESLWALDVLAELGFEYDSSIFPVRHDSYGIPAFSRTPLRLNLQSGATLVEFPLSTIRIAGLNVPVSGGGYFRIFPYHLTRLAYRRLNGAGLPIMFYMHPWEIDSQQPRLPGRLTSRMRHYANLGRTQERVRRMLAEFRFGRVCDVVDGLGI
jgi:polysaccharide deacetylase family protein (PEP-CTERM system associated)